MSLAKLRRRARGAPKPSLSYNKVCNLEDFSSPLLLPLLRTIFSFEANRFPDFPRRREYRKHWEVAMAVRALSDFGAVHKDAEILGVGAGNEPTSFILTNFSRRVFATDLYLEPGVWSGFADTSMMTDPGLHWPSRWNRNRLVTQHMNGLDLQYEDGSFDGVFSSSSIEHFGGFENVSRALDEIFRVLKPGGVFSVSTEFRIEGPEPGLPDCLMFDEAQVKEIFLNGRNWSFASPLNLEISPATLAGERRQEAVSLDVRKHVEKYGRLVNHELEFSEWPHIVLRWGPHLFTSVHLSLIKR